METLTLHYKRPPDRVEIHHQAILYADEQVLVSYTTATNLKKQVYIEGALAIEPDSPLIWFTFPDVMHDVGLFHSAAGVFTGIYADILEPVPAVANNELALTDLFLDVWIGADGKATILDADELDAAVQQGWVSAQCADAAWREANRLLDLQRVGQWPPAIVNEWPLERVRKLLNS